MAFDIVRGIDRNPSATKELIESLRNINKTQAIDGTLYIGYPLVATDESNVTVDALLITKSKGLIAFIFENNAGLADMKEQQDLLHYQIKNTLTKYESLRERRGLAFNPNVITFFQAEESVPKIDNDEYLFASPKFLHDLLLKIEEFEEKYYARLCEALQRISSMKPRKKRDNVKKDDSRGGIIRKIEKEIANLDEWQKKAAFEVPENPQRIRGLAGSGKTIVLALKAAYLHTQHPDWNIVLTYYTRALSQQYKDLISRFTFEFSGDQPNWDKLRVIHAWGSNNELGVYSLFARQIKITPTDFDTALQSYGRKYAFDGICNDALLHKPTEWKPILDAILIDEAQDLPSSFFKICYEITKEPKRIIWAYDELQNISYETSMPTIDKLFGVDSEGKPRVTLTKNDENPRQDIVLPICYRNPPWSLALAHSLGFGIYRKEGIVQLFEDLELWEEIGYKAERGDLEYGKNVTLARRADSAPRYFGELLDPNDVIMTKKFENSLEQYHWVAEQINKNIKEEELDPDDILVIFPNAYYAKRQYTEFRKFLIQRNIESILVGVTLDRDTFRAPKCISCSSIYRAKGNEAPMVYLLNADYCAKGPELITLRNILFTSITRSRAWIRICGINPDMEIIEKEIQKCIEHSYKLSFKIPTKDQLARMRLIHRDRSEEEKKKLKDTSKAINTIIEQINKGEIDLSTLPELNNLLNALKINNEREYDDESDE